MEKITLILSMNVKSTMYFFALQHITHSSTCALSFEGDDGSWYMTHELINPLEYVVIHYFILIMATSKKIQCRKLVSMSEKWNK
jgi:hypothetical protein